MPTSSGFAVGLATHDVARIGTVVWIAAPTFDEEPSVAEVEEVCEWRWPIFFPLNAALRRKIVTKIGHVAIPDEMATMPVLRSGNRKIGWRLSRFRNTDAATQELLGPATDPATPIYRIVNDTRLR
jgi:hypothetical protein